MLKSIEKLKQNLAKSHKTCMEQTEIIDTFGTYQTSVVPQPAQGSGVVFSCCSGVCWICFGFFFTDKPRIVQEYVWVRVQSPTYIGYSPADDLSVVLERWTVLCRI